MSDVESGRHTPLSYTDRAAGVSGNFIVDNVVKNVSYLVPESKLLRHFVLGNLFVEVGVLRRRKRTNESKI